MSDQVTEGSNDSIRVCEESQVPKLASEGIHNSNP